MSAEHLTQVDKSTMCHLQKAREHVGAQDLSDDSLPGISQQGPTQFQTFLDNIAAELLLRELWVVPLQLLHDAACSLALSKVQHVLYHIVSKRILQIGVE